MRKELKKLLVIFLVFVLAGCVADDTAGSQKLEPEIYYTAISDTQGFIVNQVGTLIISRTLFKNTDGEYEPYYYEIISEVIAKENESLFRQNNNANEVIVNIYNDFSKTMGLSSKLNVDNLEGVKFVVKDYNGELTLISSYQIDVETDNKTIYEEIMNDGYEWIMMSDND